MSELQARVNSPHLGEILHTMMDVGRTDCLLTLGYYLGIWDYVVIREKGKQAVFLSQPSHAPGSRMESKDRNKSKKGGMQPDDGGGRKQQEVGETGT